VGSSLIITLAPQTIDTQSTASDYLALALNIKPILTMINTQYYNSGTMNGCDGNVYAEGSVDFITALACTELQTGLSAAQIGIGLPASSAAAGSGYVDPSVVNNAVDCLATQANCGSFTPSTSAVSSYVCPVDDAAEPFVVGVVVPPDDVPADHAGLVFVGGMVGAVEREVAQCRELGFDAV
jgi:hypothetical protein